MRVEEMRENLKAFTRKVAELESDHRPSEIIEALKKDAALKSDLVAGLEALDKRLTKIEESQQ